jgi:hypothetical protein
MSAITVDFSVSQGKIKPLHGVDNGPVGYGTLVDVSHYFKELAIPYVRLHDPNWPHPREVDIPQVFPDFDADPDDPASYRFGPTDDYISRILDTGARIVYRLGVSIEHTETKYFTSPPPDFEKWAKICVGVIKHYTQGWANGMHQAVDYWEIWNEPDIGDRMWGGTFEQYLELYAITVKTIKAHDPTIKVGGYAVALVEDGRLSEFIDYCREHDLPIDFLSWHRYAESPHQLITCAQIVRTLLDESGYNDTESHLNEWNYFVADWGSVFAPGQEFARREAFERQKNQEGASFVAASLIVLQDQAVDVANYYDGQPSALYCGLFDYYGVPQKTYHAFKAFRQMLNYPVRVKAVVSDQTESLYSLAAVNPETSQAAVLMSNFDGKWSEYATLDLHNLPIEQDSEYRVYLLDQDHNLELVETGPITTPDPTIPVLLRRHAVALVTIGE